MMSKTFRKKIFFVLIYVFMLELVALTGAYLVLGAHYGNFGSIKTASLADLPTTTPPKQGMTRNGVRALHPYFGFTYRPGEEGVNQQGFNDKSDFPPLRKPNHILIGVFGGSVARDFATSQSAHDVFEEALLPSIHAAGYDYFTIVNFAVAGWRYPQQYIALQQYYRHLDLAIVIDGFNEIANGEWMVKDGVPVDFPIPQVWATLAKSNERSQLLNLAKLVEVSEFQVTVTNFFNSLPLRYAGVSHLLWQGLTFVNRERLDGYKVALEKVSGDEPFVLDSAVDDQVVERKLDDYLDSYGHGIRDADRVIRSNGRKVFFFLQPNQYIPGSKPFSADEKQAALRNTTYKTLIPKHYKNLQSLFALMYREQIQAHTLVDVFSGTKETVYVDDCCHVNENGNEIIAKEVARVLIHSGLRLADD